MTLLNRTLTSISPQDAAWREKARARLTQLTMPHWALGRLMDLAEELGGMTRSLTPRVNRKAVIVMAADHGVVAQGVSKYPPEVTGQMVRNFVHGGAGINALAGLVGADVRVVDMGVASDLTDLVATGVIASHAQGAGTADISRGPAMSHDTARACIESGIEIAKSLADEVDVFGTGEMGIGNTTPSTAIIATLADVSPAQVTGNGTGISDAQRNHKIRIVQQALDINAPNAADPLDVLAKVGGFEIGGIAGLIVGAAAQRKPIVVDGFISTAGALIAHALKPECADYMIAAHRSVEPGHRFMHKLLGKPPLLDLGLRLGEGTGAALAMHLVDAAASILTRVATFEEAQVSSDACLDT